jgi:hypothetical protein
MKLTISNNKKGVLLKADEDLSFDQGMELLMTATLALMNDFSDKVQNPEHKQKVMERIYGNYNMAASSLLDQFMPENELRPELTAEAIKRMEDIIMKEEIAKHKANN